MIDPKTVKPGDEVVVLGVGGGFRVRPVQAVYRPEGPVKESRRALVVVDEMTFRLSSWGEAIAEHNDAIRFVEATQDLRDEAERQRLSEKIRGGLAYKTLDELRKIAWVSDHEELFEIPGGENG